MGKDFNLLNVYGFNDKNDRYDLLEDLQSHMLGRVPLVVGGDFNCVLSRKDRRGAGEAFKMDKTSVLLQGMCRDFNLLDCYKTRHPREEGFTWFTGDGTKASRIDYIFTRNCPPTDARLTRFLFRSRYAVLHPFTSLGCDSRKWSVEAKLLPVRR